MTPQEIPALYLKHKSLKAIARATGVYREKVRLLYTEAVRLGLMEHVTLGGKSHAHYKNPTIKKQRVKALKTRKDTHHTFILTCAQNNTDLHLPTWMNLLALALHDNAKVYVSEFIYSKRGLGARNDKAQLKGGKPSQEEVWFDPRIAPFVNNDRVEIAKGLVWCGELNIIPTAVSPLSGLEVYTGRASMVAPHVTLAMESIPGLGGDGAKLNYTTGTVTQRNYIQRKEGFKAEFHHCYGALLVEVDDDGHWFCRQLNADSDGTIYDLDRCAKDGRVTHGHRVEAINLGDTHNDEKDETVHAATFGAAGLVETLDPKFIFVHDVLDFDRRGHHRIKDPYEMMLRYAQKRESVHVEVSQVRRFIVNAADPERREIVIVRSNHDDHLDRWMRENDGRFDPVNAEYWGYLNHLKTSYIMVHKAVPDMLALAIRHMGDIYFEKTHNVRFLNSDSSFVICPKSGNGIECGLHGDRGANGTRGSRRQFAKSLGRRSNIGHSHSAGITQGCFQAGTNSLLKLSYNQGLSSWTHSDIITYANGKRAIVTFFNGKWRA